MDRDNLHNVKHLDAGNRYAAKIKLFREYDPDPGDMEVPDPYYGGNQGFENVYKMLDEACEIISKKL